MEILPAIDIRGGKCVRLRQGDYSRETVFSDDPVEMARRWADAGGHRLHLVDLDGARAGHPVNVEVVRAIVRGVGIPCQMGGGIRTIDDVRSLLDDVGLDRVIVGTRALKDPEWFSSVASQFAGKLCLGLDARNSQVATEGWLETSETSALALAERYRSLPLAAIIYTNIANDGMMQGIDPATLNDLASLARLGVNVIASGGVTTLDDIRALHAIALQEPKLSGVIIGRALYEGTVTVEDAERIVSAQGESTSP